MKTLDDRVAELASAVEACKGAPDRVAARAAIKRAAKRVLLQLDVEYPAPPPKPRKRGKPQRKWACPVCERPYPSNKGASPCCRRPLILVKSSRARSPVSPIFAAQLSHVGVRSYKSGDSFFAPDWAVVVYKISGHKLEAVDRARKDPKYKAAMMAAARLKGAQEDQA